MKEITIYKNPYLQAYQTPFVIKMEAEELQKRTIVALAKCYSDVGRTINAKGLAQLATALIAEIKKYFANIRIGEVEYCLELGIRKEYGEYFGINIVTINQWLKAYMVEEKRHEAILLDQPKESVKQEPTAEEKIKIRDDFILMCETKFKTSGHWDWLIAPISLLYYNLVEVGILQPDEYLQHTYNAFISEKEHLFNLSRTQVLLDRRKTQLARLYLTRESKSVIDRAKKITIADLWVS